MTRTAPAYYVAGTNAPGYLPDAEPATFLDAEEPWRYLAELCEREADEADDNAACAEWLNAARTCRALIGTESGDVSVWLPERTVALWVQMIALDDAE